MNLKSLKKIIQKSVNICEPITESKVDLFIIEFQLLVY